LTKRADFTGQQRYYRQKDGFPHADQPQSPEADVLLTLSRYAPALEELSRAVAERPLTRFPVDWYRGEIFGMRLPHYNLEQQLVSTLRLRASAQLAEGRTEDALRDLELALRLCLDMSADPNLIAHLVQITCLNLALNSLWEGLADRRWAAAQLARLQAELQRFDMLANYLFAICGERAFSLHGLDYIMTRHDASVLLLMGSSHGVSSDRDEFLSKIVAKMVPGGWFDLNKVQIASFEQDYLIESIDLKARRVLPDKLVAGRSVLEVMPTYPTTSLAKIMLPVFESIAIKPALMQTGLDEALTACALERFFLERQRYPAGLDELVPAYMERIPTDVIDGAPLRYRPTADGRYRLYGIGWNARNDGGKVVWETSRKPKDAEGDWVWQYAELQPPPAGTQ
jgi:hypothetical protein